jgi:hypothetical protein
VTGYANANPDGAWDVALLAVQYVAMAPELRKSHENAAAARLRPIRDKIERIGAQRLCSRADDGFMAAGPTR